MVNSENLRLGVIGCGTVVETAYLPASRDMSGAKIVALADKNIERARDLGARYGVSTCVDNYRELPSDLDGVIIALPHYLHAPVAIEFLNRQAAVLVEKPLALTSGSRTSDRRCPDK